MYQITRKGHLARNLKRLQKLFPLEYDFFPKSWIMPNELNDLKYHAIAPKQPKDSVKKKKAMSKTEKLEKFEQQLEKIEK